MRLITLLAALVLALPAAPALAQVKEPRRVSTAPTTTCKAWVNWANATVVCRDTPFEELPVGTCLSQGCNGGGVVKVVDGIYTGALDGRDIGKGHGRLERHDGSVVEGNFRKGLMWEVTATFQDGVMWKGTVANETTGASFGEWAVYRDEGSTRYSAPISYGTLFEKPDFAAIADARGRLKGEAGTAPPKPGLDLTPIVERSRGLTVVTTSEKWKCYGLYLAMAEAIPEYGRMGLPDGTFLPATVVPRAKKWEKWVAAQEKKSPSGEPWSQLKDENYRWARAFYDKGDLATLADWAGVCMADPKE
eukprot:gene9309-9121_t